MRAGASDFTIDGVHLSFIHDDCIENDQLYSGIVENNVFRADSKPNHQTLGLPKGYDVKCSNNVVVWLGKGRYPDHLPKCFTVTRDRKVWDRAVAKWHAAHPTNP